jgi:hypothetical protein
MLMRGVTIGRRVALLMLATLVLLAAAGSGGAARPLAGRSPSYLTFAERGVAGTAVWINPRTGWYREALSGPKRHWRTSIWDSVPLWEAIDEIAQASPTRAHLRAVEAFANTAGRYLDSHLKPGPGYTPSPSNGPDATAFFDDNAWWGLAYAETYRLTKRRSDLLGAERAFTFIARYAWDPRSGGMWWATIHGRHSGGTLSAAAQLAARLYQLTGRHRFLAAALKYIEWANHHVLKWDGTYGLRLRHSHEPPMSHAGEGAMLGAMTVLCQLRAPVPSAVYEGLPPDRLGAHPSYKLPPDPRSWCSWAEALATDTVYGVKAGGNVLDAYVPLKEAPQFDAIYVRDILGLFGLDHRARWYQLAAGTAQQILRNARSPNGLFTRGWNGAVRIPGATPGRLRTDAASVSVFAALAAATKPPPRTGGASPRAR